MPQSNYEQAEARALAITAKRSEGWTQRAIAEQLGLTRDIVAYYLRPNCKARLRAVENAALRGHPIT